MNINQSIENLLHDHECVIIPQFGGFVTNYKAAFVHPQKEMVFPPSKQVSFNVNLKNNDGLLANYISQKENVSYQVALSFVQDAVSDFRNTLDSKKRLQLSGIGTVSVNQNGALEFSPENTTNFLRNSFGLAPVFIPSLEELLAERNPVEAETEPAVIVEENTVSTPVIPLVVKEIEEKRKKAFPVKWLAAAAILPLMYFGGMSVQQNSESISSFFSSFMPAKKATVTIDATFNPRIEDEQTQFTYSEPTSELKAIADQNPELKSVFYSFDKAEISPDGLKVNLETKAAVSTNNTDSPAPTFTNSAESETSSLELYFIVAGCFQERENADGLVKKLRRKGFDAGIFGKKGSLHLVCYGSFTNKTAAKGALSKIQSDENPGAWLKKH